MRWHNYFLALTIFVAQNATPNDAGSVGALMFNKSAEQLVEVPIQELWKDIYVVLKRKFFHLYYKIAYLLNKNEITDYSDFLMEKLKNDIFGGLMNPKMTKSIHKSLRLIFAEWWNSAAENPNTVLVYGSWYTLNRLNKEVLSSYLKKSKSIDKLKEILEDPDVTVIKSWVKSYLTPPPKNIKKNDTYNSTGNKLSRHMKSKNIKSNKTQSTKSAKQQSAQIEPTQVQYAQVEPTQEQQYAQVEPTQQQYAQVEPTEQEYDYESTY